MFLTELFLKTPYKRLRQLEYDGIGNENRSISVRRDETWS